MYVLVYLFVFVFDFYFFFFFFSSRRRHTRSYGDWSSDVCSSDLNTAAGRRRGAPPGHQGIRTRNHEPPSDLQEGVAAGQPVGLDERADGDTVLLGERGQGVACFHLVRALRRARSGDGLGVGGRWTEGDDHPEGDEPEPRAVADRARSHDSN